MAVTGDNRPLDLTSSRRKLAWWNKDNAEQAVPKQNSPKSTTGLAPSISDHDIQTPASPMSMDLSGLMRPKKQRRVIINELPQGTNQELFDMDIAQKIGPEPVTLASTRQLHRATWALLKKFQQAYREQSVTVVKLQAEVVKVEAAHKEEVARTAKLKVALEGAKKIIREHETSIEELMMAVTNEQKARIQQSEQIIIQPPDDGDILISPSSITNQSKARMSVTSSAGSVLSEDLGVDADQTDSDSTAESSSIFSRSRSPTLRSSLGNGEDALSLNKALVSSSMSIKSGRSISAGLTSTLAAQRSLQLTPTTGGLGKLFSGLTGGITQKVEIVTSCSNCRDEPASIAWETVSVLRDHNKELKDRVTVMETEVEGALDIVRGVAPLTVSMNLKPWSSIDGAPADKVNVA